MSLEFEYNNKIKSLINERNNIEYLENKIIECNEILNNNESSSIDHFNAYQSKLKSERLVNELKKYTKTINYFNNVLDILKEYNTTNDKMSCYNDYSKLFETKIDTIDNCANCGTAFDYTTMVLNSSIICPSCGMETPVIQFNDAKSSNEISINKYSYKRVVHFLDKIRRLQACENTKIPQEIYNSIKLECKKEHINVSDITIDKIRMYLAKYRYTKYYDNAYQIYKHLTNKTILNNSENIEVQLVNKFTQVEEVYDSEILINSKNRTNFINYKYILYKLCQLLNYNEYLEYIQLSKNKSKLQQLDSIWKQIVNILHWEYIPTI